MVAFSCFLFKIRCQDPQTSDSRVHRRLASCYLHVNAARTALLWRDSMEKASKISQIYKTFLIFLYFIKDIFTGSY